MSYNGELMDPMLEISVGSNGIKYVNKFGRNPDVDTGTVPEDIVNGNTALYVPPTSAQTMDITAGANDTGSLVASGTITTASLNQIIDTGADFITAGVTKGDIILNDSTMDHSMVLSVDSATVLTVIPMHHGDVNEIGNTYRIARATGTGAAVVHIEDALDSNLDYLSEFVILNGAATVSTVNQYLRVNRAHIHGAGSSGANVANVEITASVDGTLTARIPAGLGQTMIAHYTIPRGYTGYITNVSASLFKTGAASDALAQVSLYINNWRVFGVQDGDVIKGSWGLSVFTSLTNKYAPYLKVYEFADVWLRCEDVSDSDSIVSGGFDLILVPNG